MDVVVNRNAFGRQVDSFEADLDVRGLDGGPVRAVFIRAPLIQRVDPPAEAIATLDDGTVVAARERNLLAISFHPELTGRENIYLNGAILGMTRAEITRKLDEIIEFAEMAKFIELYRWCEWQN